MNNFTAMDIANYIVEYTNQTLKKSNLTPIKLQKIMYYVYVHCLVKHDIKLFDQPIEKWKFGPVISNVYHNFKVYGTSHIDATVAGYEFIDEPNGAFSFQVIPFDSSIIESDTVIANEIKSTVDNLIGRAPFDLVEQTHDELPWKRYESQILGGAKGLVYTDQEIKEFFSGRLQ